MSSYVCSPIKVFEELEELAGRVIGNYWSQWDYYDLEAGLRDWKVNQRLYYSRRNNLDFEEISQIFRDEHRVEQMLTIMKSLFKAVKRIHLGLKSQTQTIASKLSNGFNSLPDDLLMLIFEFSNPPGEGTQQAVWLSHVSRRFRRLSFSACHLWTTLHSDAQDEELEDFIPRCGPKSELSIVLSLPSLGKPESFMDYCVPLASRWRTFTVWSGSDETEDPGDPVTVDEVMQQVFARYSQLEIPRLQELRITQRRWDVDSGNDSWTTERFVPSWSMPNLRSMICDEYIPLPSPTHSSLCSFTTSFSLATEQYPARFTDLLAFLDSTTGLTHLDLTVRTFVDSLHPLQLTKRTYNSIISLSLHFSPFTLPDGITGLFLPLISDLVMPNLESLSTSFEFEYDDLLDEPEDSVLLQYVVNTLLLCCTKLANLTSLNIEFTHSKETSSRPRDFRHKIAIRKEDYPRALGDGSEPSIALRELRLHDCTEYDMEMLKDTVATLNANGRWDTLESFKLEGCFHRCYYDAVLREVGEERLCFIPIRKTKFGA